MKRDFKLEHHFEVLHGLGLGIAIGNHQPYKKYATARLEFALLILCFSYSVSLSFNYKSK